MRMTVALCLLAWLVPALPGCFVTTQASQIEAGQAITTGKPAYDAFFQDVRAVREESLKAEADAAGARVGLLRALGLQGEAKLSEAVEAARARATKLKAAGVLLHLDLTPEAKLVSDSGKSKLESEDQSVMDALEESAKSSLAVSLRLDQLSTRAAVLEKKRKELSDAQATFADPGQRDQVRREIAAAEQVLAQAAERSDKHAAIASKFVLDLALAVETGADTGQPTAAAGKTASTKRPAAGRKPPPGASRPAAASPPGASRPAAASPAQPPAQPKPPPKPSGGEDFEP